MKKGYWVVHVTIQNAAQFAQYVEQNQYAFGLYHAKFLARGGAFVIVEGATDKLRHILIEFPNFQTALDCWHSQEYQLAKQLREGACDIQIVVMEGV